MLSKMIAFGSFVGHSNGQYPLGQKGPWPLSSFTVLCAVRPEAPKPTTCSKPLAAGGTCRKAFQGRFRLWEALGRILFGRPPMKSANSTSCAGSRSKHEAQCPRYVRGRIRARKFSTGGGGAGFQGRALGHGPASPSGSGRLQIKGLRSGRRTLTRLSKLEVLGMGRGG